MQRLAAVMYRVPDVLQTGFLGDTHLYGDTLDLRFGDAHGFMQRPALAMYRVPEILHGDFVGDLFFGEVFFGDFFLGEVILMVFFLGVLSAGIFSTLIFFFGCRVCGWLLTTTMTKKKLKLFLKIGF